MMNAEGVIADMFSSAERGLAARLFATAPFPGPPLGTWWMSFYHAAIFAIVALVRALILNNFYFQGPLPVVLLSIPRAGAGFLV